MPQARTAARNIPDPHPLPDPWPPCSPYLPDSRVPPPRPPPGLSPAAGFPQTLPCRPQAAAASRDHSESFHIREWVQRESSPHPSDRLPARHGPCGKPPPLPPVHPREHSSPGHIGPGSPPPLPAAQMPWQSRYSTPACSPPGNTRETLPRPPRFWADSRAPGYNSVWTGNPRLPAAFPDRFRRLPQYPLKAPPIPPTGSPHPDNSHRPRFHNPPDPGKNKTVRCSFHTLSRLPPTPSDWMTQPLFLLSQPPPQRHRTAAVRHSWQNSAAHTPSRTPAVRPSARFRPRSRSPQPYRIFPPYPIFLKAQTHTLY